MGLFSRGKGGGIDFGRVLDGFSAAQATLAGDYGAAASIHNNRNRLRAAERAAREEAEAERRQIQQQQEALAAITDREGNPLFTKQQILGMRPEDVSQLAREYAQPRQFTAQGGSVLDPRTGTFTQAPWREQVGPDIVGQQPGGPIETLRRGVSPVSVEGVGVFGMTSDGRVVGPEGIPQGPQGAPQAPQSPVAPQPQGITGPPRISSQAEYEALPPGAVYIAPDGTPRRKGGAGSGQQNFR